MCFFSSFSSSKKASRSQITQENERQIKKAHAEPPCLYAKTNGGDEDTYQGRIECIPGNFLMNGSLLKAKEIRCFYSFMVTCWNELQQPSKEITDWEIKTKYGILSLYCN